MFRLRFLLLLLLTVTSLRLFAYEPLIFSSADISHIGIYIEDLATGKTVATYNDKKVLVPASVMKSVTAASVQQLVPASFCFVTKVYPTGVIDGKTLYGNIIIEGSGDPTLGSRFFSDTQPDFIKQVVRHIRSIGIDSISGDILIDESCRSSIGVSPYWLQEDFAWEYGAGLFGINFRDNSFSMSLSAGTEPKVKISDIEVENLTTRTGSDEIVAMRGYDSSVLTISGSVAKTYASRYSLPSPAVELYTSLLSALTSNGITIGENIIDDSSTPDLTKAFAYKSPSRDKILKVMMHKSDNLFAEGMLHSLANKTTAAVKRERDLWSSRGIDLSGSRWLDGSGLSPVERISPRTLGQILSSMARSTGSAEYIAIFPLAGRDGTVKSLLKDTRLDGRMALKSGSMNGVKCYAGYRLDLAGRPTHTVVIMVNGFSCKGSAVTKAIETYLLDILP